MIGAALRILRPNDSLPRFHFLYGSLGIPFPLGALFVSIFEDDPFISVVLRLESTLGGPLTQFGAGRAHFLTIPRFLSLSNFEGHSASHVNTDFYETNFVLRLNSYALKKKGGKSRWEFKMQIYDK